MGRKIQNPPPEYYGATKATAPPAPPEPYIPDYNTLFETHYIEINHTILERGYILIKADSPRLIPGFKIRVDISSIE